MALRHENYTLALVSAMSIEMSAVRFMLDHEHPPLTTVAGDSHMYFLGDLHGHNVVLTCLPGQQGKGAAAIAATNLNRTFPSIQYWIFVGIAGGVPSSKHNIRLGDVVISMPDGDHNGVVQYDLVKDMEDEIRLKGFLHPPPARLRSAVEMMRSEHMIHDNKINGFVDAMLRKYPRLRRSFGRPSEAADVLFKPDYLHDSKKASCDHCNPSETVDRTAWARETEGSALHYGLVASGDSVKKSARKRDEIISRVGDVLCFEMEAAGVMSGFPCLVIRGISDYADSHKNDGWHGYAAAAAAGAAKELLAWMAAAPSTTAGQTGEGQGQQAQPGMDQHFQGIQHSGSGNFNNSGNISVSSM